MQGKEVWEKSFKFIFIWQFQVVCSVIDHSRSQWLRRTTLLYLWNGVFTDQVIFRLIFPWNQAFSAYHKSCMRNYYPWWLRIVTRARTCLKIAWSVKMTFHSQSIGVKDSSLWALYHRWLQNVAAEIVHDVLPHFDVFSDLLVNRRQATWHLFNIKNQIKGFF